MGKNICLVIHRGPDFEFKMTVNPMRKQWLIEIQSLNEPIGLHPSGLTSSQFVASGVGAPTSSNSYNLGIVFTNILKPFKYTIHSYKLKF